jgi:hypothetical protein
MHKNFEGLCALAATGQITGDAMKVLDQHVKECDQCRTFLQEVVPLKAHVAPVVAAQHARMYEPPEGMRERFLQRAAAAGLTLNPGLAASDAGQPANAEMTTVYRLDPAPKVSFAWFHTTFRVAVPVMAGILCVALGYQAALHKSKGAPVTVAVAPVPVRASSPQLVADPEELEKLQRGGAEARAQLQSTTAKLVKAQQEKHDLLQQLATVSQSAAQDARLEQNLKSVTLELQNADERITKLLADLQTEKNRAAAADAILVAQQNATVDANQKVATLQAQLEQSRNLDTAKGMEKELIAARNLHIVDVYDTESSGSRKKAFGRVFYVEGRSLVFYAYDLSNAKRASKNLEFRVWGEQAGVKSVSVSLGVMHNDDPGQRRWVLTCDDPKVLGRINAVYISPDSDSRRGSETRGEKMMYAFLGSPNHP